MQSSGNVAVCSHRLGETDGVSIEATKWIRAFEVLGWRVRTVAGAGTADVLVPELRADATTPPQPDVLEAAFAGADLVVVENICSLKLHNGASEALASFLAGRPTILHHHDLAIERPDRSHLGPPQDEASWIHVCISDHARTALANHNISASVLYNHFDPDPPRGDRIATRAKLGIDEHERVVLQPTRAIPRKDVPAGLQLAENLGAIYWLLGPPEDGYDGELDRIYANASTRFIRRRDLPEDISIDDAYAACDVVALPSTWEGFGNPAIESATHRRPLAIGSYPVASELARFGFRWFSAADPGALESFLQAPDSELIDHNAGVARAHFSLADLPRRLHELLSRTGLDALHT